MNGESILHLKDKELSKLRRSQIGFIYQDYSLLPEFTAYENMLAFGVLFLFALCKELKSHQWKIDTLQQEILTLKQNQMKEDFIFSQNKKMQSFIENIAHQMKTPLSRVFSSLDIVQDSFEDETAKQHVEECYQHLESMNVLMKRLMDIGRLEAGKVIFQKERFYLDELLEDVKNSCTKDVSRVNVYCKLDKVDYYGDEEWLKEAFSNM